MKTRRTRRITVLVRVRPPDLLLDEEKRVHVALHSHGSLTLSRSIGAAAEKTFHLRGPDRSCLMVFDAPAGERLFLHGSASVFDPADDSGGPFAESRYAGYDIQEVPPGAEDRFYILTIAEFHRFRVSRRTPSVETADQWPCL